MSLMPYLVQLACRTARAIFALGCGVFAGTILAVLIAEGRLSAAADLAWRAGWIIRGRPIAPGEADGTWMLEAEARYAFMIGLIIACISSMIWALVVWRRQQSYFAAAMIGLVLASAMASLSFYHDEVIRAIFHTILIGLSGAIAGILTRAVDQALGGQLPTLRHRT